MEENQSISKKEKISRVSLSDLPLSIIHIILALVPIRDAIRTSILSRQWRYAWASLPRLVFTYELASRSYTNKNNDIRLHHFITQALFHHKGPIHECEISGFYGLGMMDGKHIDEWILCLSRSDIKELTLDMGAFSIYRVVLHKVSVPSSIYSCEKLTQLGLYNCKLDPPPSDFKGLLFLRCLILCNVCVSSNAIESLVANSPLLERLRLSRLENKELRISAPNLKYLDLKGDFLELCVYAPLLADMSMTLCYDNFATNHANFMGGLINLETLFGGEFFIKYLSMGAEACHQTFVFNHLWYIELEDVDFEDIKFVSVVARLIVGAPNLKELRFANFMLDAEAEDGYYDSDDGEAEVGDYESEAPPHQSIRDFGCAPNFTFAKLRVVTMSNVRGLPLEMEFIKFLLESSPVLKTMYLDFFFTVDKPKLEAELLGFARASSNAKLSFRN